MYIKKIGVLVFVLLVFSVNAYAANLSSAYNWLDKQKPVDVFSAALGALALNEVSGGKEYFDYLTNAKNKDNCWPSQNCKGKETALAALALSKSGENVDSSLEWLKNHQLTSLTGDWFLQIDTQSTGDCDIEYKKSQNQVKKVINVEKGFIKSGLCQAPSTLFNLGKCLENNILSSPPVIFDIKCNFDGKFSSLYSDQGIYYLNDDVTSGQSATIKINNGHFSNLEETLFVNWVLKNLNYDSFDNLIYLRKNYIATDVKSNAFLYMITQKQTYANELSNLQKQDGSFGSVFDTAIALLALNEDQSKLESGIKWLDGKQDAEGTWNKNIVESSLILYSAYPKTGIDLGNKKTEVETEENTEPSACNNDNTCNFGETALECPNDCSCGDNKCDSSESSLICPLDCKEEQTGNEVILCGNNAVDENEECDGSDDKNCPGLCNLDCTCKKEEKSSGFFKYILILIILGIGLFFLYKKFGNNIISKFKQKKQPSKPTFGSIQNQQPRVEKTEFKGPINLLKSVANAEPGRKSRIEEDLEKSLKEAKKILER